MDGEVPPDAFLLANTLHDALQAIWTEATLRAEVDQDALFALWARFEALHDEIGGCIGRHGDAPGDLVAALRDLEARIQDERREVRAGAFDVARRAV